MSSVEWLEREVEGEMPRVCVCLIIVALLGGCCGIGSRRGDVFENACTPFIGMRGQKDFKLHCVSGSFDLQPDKPHIVRVRGVRATNYDFSLRLPSSTAYDRNTRRWMPEWWAGDVLTLTFRSSDGETLHACQSVLGERMEHGGDPWVMKIVGDFLDGRSDYDIILQFHGDRPLTDVELLGSATQVDGKPHNLLINRSVEPNDACRRITRWGEIKSSE